MAINVNKNGILKNIAGVTTTGFTINGIEKYVITSFYDRSGNFETYKFNLPKKFNTYKYMLMILLCSWGTTTTGTGYPETFCCMDIEQFLSANAECFRCCIMPSDSANKYLSISESSSTIGNLTEIRFTTVTSLVRTTVLMIY